MSFELQHTFVSERFTPILQTLGEATFFKVSEEGKFAVHYPGRIFRRATTTFRHTFRVDPIEGQPKGKPFETVTQTMPVKISIFTPDGREFTRPEISLADLRKFRDLRGVPFGEWSYKITGESQHFFLDSDLSESLHHAQGTLGIGVTETVASESAPPLIANVRLSAAGQSFTFDLFRVGRFVAEIESFVGTWRGSMRLLDPDGVEVARTTGRRLRFEVSLPTLNKSRDAAGRVRKWTLIVVPQGGVFTGEARISATVIGSVRINTEVLKSRIDSIIGKRGSFLEVFGENKNDEALVRLKITDKFAAENIDKYKLLDIPLSKATQDEGVNPQEIKKDVIYTLFRHDESLARGIKLELKTLKLSAIVVEIGPGVRLGAAVPAVRLSLEVAGKAKLKLGPKKLADAKVRGGKLEVEVGLKLSPDGTPQIVTAMSDSPFDIDVDTEVAIVLGLFGAGLKIATEVAEDMFNKKLGSILRDVFSDPMLVTSLLMMFLGAHLTYTSIRIEESDIVFKYIAPLELALTPRASYAGVIGRGIVEFGPGVTKFQPPFLPNTWAADNLSKVDHIVVVMMENRSYDHVLGYRAQGAKGDGADGLTEEMRDAIQKTSKAEGGTYQVRELGEAGFDKNEVKLMTKLPKNVGHHLEDVAQQLSERVSGPGNRPINSPKGFVDNFKPKLGSDAQGVVEDDVLGYYVAKDLPFFAYLAEHYAYCDRYYCSHPGPTLPNRMYSLTGDVQYDRFGVPILNNNHGDNFLLSRAMTIYDWLTRQGISWRVYESHPSVTMLRMFARYAGDNTNIVPLERLEADMAAGNLPSFTAIEPAMHHAPQDDDHPPADMYRGQIFLQRVYNALRSNSALWQKTMLIITYDEHGGLYDHVIPPIADLLSVQIDVKTDNPNVPPPPPAQAPATLRVPYGVRVPTFVVSPWTTRGKGPSLTLDHCSILKTVLARFDGANKPFLSDRVHASQTFNAFLTEASPRLDVPPPTPLSSLPAKPQRVAKGATAIVTQPLSRKAMREGPVDYHDLTGWLARQLGR